MRIRELERRDADQVTVFLKNEFPAEERVMGTRPEGVVRIVHRIFRLDSRIVLGLLRLFGRRFFHFFVIEEGDGIAGTTLLTFNGPTGYLSMVVVDPKHRRKGYARALIERAREASARARKQWVALDVLTDNTPARTLYEAVGYRKLRTAAFFAHDDAPAIGQGAPPATGQIRPFRRSDTKPLVEIVRRLSPPDVERVLPTNASAIAGSGTVDRMLETQTAAWVVDRGRGPEAWMGASVSPVTEAAHFSTPILAETVEPERATELVRTAAAWVAARGGRRLVCSVPEDRTRARAALEGVGFRAAFETLTLYRPTA